MSQTAIVQNEIGKRLVLTKRPIPEPPAGHILVKVTSAGLNPHDQKSRDVGLFSKDSVPGAVLANDVVGGIVKVGPAVARDYKIGDRVFAQSNAFAGPDHGGLQEYALIDAKYSSKVPENLKDDEVNTLPTNLMAGYVAFFTSAGLGLPLPGTDAAKDFNYKSQSILIIGGGSNCGKFGVQLAKWADFGTIVVVAGTKNETQLKQFGATHVVDRHSNDVLGDIKAVVGDDLVYAYDAVNIQEGQALGVAALSNSTKGTLVTLLRPPVDHSKLGEKRAGFEVKQIIGLAWRHPEMGEIFWNRLVGKLLDTGAIVPLDYQVVEGLDVDKVNAVYDQYAAGRAQSKIHVHP